ncbi:hypothetical protein ICN19_04260 [Polynucleobacter sp. AP-Capit-er-40B-B4]|uniref:hypothetical protein n=1 Tax=Polynucleobacter sp. AP-Capit-er-40B-B4 TaxID=2576927 RepID=UPI001C0E6084|nr:hypothetical protein [Polynucleobacter sp. AP-Capit-er-40B-B4]MBU3581231.1 hypothetical protein [Polynucleobacter sp. AP-Capit-er-40B-B4]
MAFQGSTLKNGVMPARHISSQSFDEILSDLGDDPAIPDPHGIRKPPSPQGAPSKASGQNDHPRFVDSLHKLQIPNSVQKMGVLIVLFLGVLIAAAVAVSIAFNTLNQASQSTQEESQKLISELKKEMALMRDEFHQDQDDLYAAIDEIEVSIHSLMNKKPESRVSSKPKTPSYEAELRRWRYLGAAQMGGSHQAFFNTGKSNIAFEKGGQALGEWRLSSIENDSAIFSHPEGKFLVLKAFSNE